MKLFNEIDINLKLNKKDFYLLGCSYGPDSRCLFDLLIKNKINFIVCFVNYKTRKESDLEEKAINKLCNKENITLEVLTSKLNLKENNFEKKARKIRYDFFVKTCKKYNIKNILIAHHLDDLVETYYLQKISKRINKFVGLTYLAIFKDGINIIRPLLIYKKDTILDYCYKNNIDFSIDYTNFENNHLRNKLRNNELKKLTDLDKYLILLNTIKENLLLTIKYKQIISSSKSKILDLSILNELSLENKKRVIYYFLDFNFKNKYQIKNYELNFVIEKLNEFNYLEIDKYLLFKFNNFIYLIKQKKLDKLYELKLNKNVKYLGFDKEIFEMKFKNSIDDLKIIPLISFNKVKISSYYKNTKRYLKDLHCPILISYLWPCVVNNYNELIYFPRYDEKYENKERNILNFKIDNLVKFLN